MSDIGTNSIVMFFKKGPLKVIAVVTLWSFLFSIVGGDFLTTDLWAANISGERPNVRSYDDSSPLISSGTEKIDLNTFQLPENLGKVKNICNTYSDKVIVHIQDAHCNYKAQKKIEQIIKYFKNTYGINVINLEGAAKGFDLSIFTDIRNKDIRCKVADHFVKEGLVSGPEEFAINNTESIKLWGIENVDLYIKNLDVYRNFLLYKEQAGKDLNSLACTLETLKRRIYSDKLLEIDKKYSQYKSREMDFDEYFKYLTKIAVANSISFDKYPNVEYLMRSLKKEKDIDFKKANDEQDELVGKLRLMLSKTEFGKVVLKTVEFKKNIISKNSYYAFLVKKAKFVNISLNDYAELEKYFEYINIYSFIDKSVLMQEISLLEMDVKELFFTNDEQKMLSELSKNLIILKAMFEFSLTPMDYNYYLENKDDFRIARFSGFIEKEILNYGIGSGLNTSIFDLDKYREDIVKFYEYSFQRDQAFIKNMKYSQPAIKGAGFAKNETAMLVTGGFHADDLRSLFKENGISYISIIPNFKIPEEYMSPYFKLLSGNCTDTVYKKLYSGITSGYMLQIALMLSGAIAKQVWGKPAIKAFHADVILQEMVEEKKWTINEITSNEITYTDAASNKRQFPVEELLSKTYESETGAKGLNPEEITDEDSSIRGGSEKNKGSKKNSARNEANVQAYKEIDSLINELREKINFSKRSFSDVGLMRKNENSIVEIGEKVPIIPYLIKMIEIGNDTDSDLINNILKKVLSDLVSSKGASSNPEDIKLLREKILDMIQREFKGEGSRNEAAFIRKAPLGILMGDGGLIKNKAKDIFNLFKDSLYRDKSGAYDMSIFTELIPVLKNIKEDVLNFVENDMRTYSGNEDILRAVKEVSLLFRDNSGRLEEIQDVIISIIDNSAKREQKLKALKVLDEVSDLFPEDDMKHRIYKLFISRKMEILSGTLVPGRILFVYNSFFTEKGLSFFKEMGSDLDNIPLANQYSLARGIEQTISRYNKTLSSKLVYSLLGFYLGLQKKHRSRTVLDKDTDLIIACNEDSAFEPLEIENFAKSFMPGENFFKGQVQSFKGTSDFEKSLKQKKNLLRSLSGINKKTTFWFSGHGFTDAIELGGNIGSREGVMITYQEFAETLLKNSKINKENGQMFLDLSQLSIIMDCCYSVDYLTNVFNYINNYCEKNNVKIRGMPFSITSTNRGAKGWKDNLFSSVLPKTKVKDNNLTVDNFMQAETLIYQSQKKKYQGEYDEFWEEISQDPSFLVPITYEETLELNKTLSKAVNEAGSLKIEGNDYLGKDVPVVNLIGKLFTDKDLHNDYTIARDVRVRRSGDTLIFKGVKEGKEVPLFDAQGERVEPISFKPATRTNSISIFGEISTDDLTGVDLKIAEDILKTYRSEKVFVLKKNDNGIRGSPDEDGNIYLTEDLLNDPVALFHETGESIKKEIEQLTGVNAHTYLRGCGKEVKTLLETVNWEDVNTPEKLIDYIETKLPLYRVNEQESRLIRYNTAKGLSGYDLVCGLQDRLFGIEKNERLSGDLMREQITGQLDFEEHKCFDSVKMFFPGKAGVIKGLIREREKDVTHDHKLGYVRGVTNIIQNGGMDIDDTIQDWKILLGVGKYKNIGFIDDFNFLVERDIILLHRAMTKGVSFDQYTFKKLEDPVRALNELGVYSYGREGIEELKTSSVVNKIIEEIIDSKGYVFELLDYAENFYGKPLLKIMVAARLGFNSSEWGHGARFYPDIDYTWDFLDFISEYNMRMMKVPSLDKTIENKEKEYTIRLSGKSSFTGDEDKMYKRYKSDIVQALSYLETPVEEAQNIRKMKKKIYKQITEMAAKVRKKIKKIDQLKMTDSDKKIIEALIKRIDKMDEFKLRISYSDDKEGLYKAFSSYMDIVSGDRVLQDYMITLSIIFVGYDYLINGPLNEFGVANQNGIALTLQDNLNRPFLWKIEDLKKHIVEIGLLKKKDVSYFLKRIFKTIIFKDAEKRIREKEKNVPMKAFIVKNILGEMAGDISPSCINQVENIMGYRGLVGTVYFSLAENGTENLAGSYLIIERKINGEKVWVLRGINPTYEYLLDKKYSPRDFLLSSIDFADELCRAYNEKHSPEEKIKKLVLPAEKFARILTNFYHIENEVEMLGLDEVQEQLDPIENGKELNGDKYAIKEVSVVKSYSSEDKAKEGIGNGTGENNAITERKRATEKLLSSVQGKRILVKTIAGLPALKDSPVNTLDITSFVRDVNKQLSENDFGVVDDTYGTGDTRQILPFSMYLNNPERTLKNIYNEVDKAKNLLSEQVQDGQESQIVIYAPYMPEGKGLKLAIELQEHFKNDKGVTVIPDEYSDLNVKEKRFPDIMARSVLARHIAFGRICELKKNSSGLDAALKSIKAFLGREAYDMDLDKIKSVSDLMKIKNALRIRPIDYQDIIQWCESQREIDTSL